MKLRIVTRPRYDEDLAEHFSVIFQDKPEPGFRFLKVAEECANRLAELPLIGTEFESEVPHLQGIRSYPMPNRFRNYVIFYRLLGDQLELLTMLHGARDLERALKEVI